MNIERLIFGPFFYYIISPRFLIALIQHGEYLLKKRITAENIEALR